MLAVDSWLGEPRSRAGSLAILLGMLALSYFVVLGEAALRDPAPVIRALNAVIAGSLILIYLVNAPRLADRVDRGVLLAVLLFAGAAVLSQFPRQSFDALLGALLFAAGFFVARSLLAVDDGRRAFAICLMALSAGFTFLTAARWLPPFLEWWALNDWQVFPPLNLELPSVPWGHRHDLALLVVMLYPSWWLGRISPLRAAVGTVVGVLTLLLVIVDGSRTIWLATAVASAAVLLPIGLKRVPRDSRGQLAIGLVAVAGAAAVVISGVLGTVLERVLNAGTVGARWAMWEPLLNAWLAEPVAGYGPGSFAWALQQTSYFDTNSFAPRHPDSAIFQLLPEAGLLGGTAVITILATLLPPILRGPSLAARWVLITFAVAGLGANPTDFGFLVAVAIGWAAFAVPRESADRTDTPVPRPWLKAVTVAAFSVVAVAWTAMAAADMSYHSARAAITGERVEEAIPQLELAASLDPGMALYARQLGTAQLLSGNTSAAILNLERATRLNPSDDLAWRALALAHAASGNSGAAGEGLARAVEVQRSDPTNLLLAAKWETEYGSEVMARAILEEVVQAWPEIVAGPGWSEVLPPNTTTRDVLEGAFDRWSQGLPSLEPGSQQPIQLAIWAGRTDVAGESAADAFGASLGAIYVAEMGCDASAIGLLRTAPGSVLRASTYWSLVIRQSILDGQANAQAVRLFSIMTGAPLRYSTAAETMDPLDENDVRGYSADLWGYRRLPIAWPDYQELPSPVAGALRTIVEPLAALDAAGLEAVCPIADD